jgi:hypothetical protein
LLEPEVEAVERKQPVALELRLLAEELEGSTLLEQLVLQTQVELVEVLEVQTEMVQTEALG